MDNLFLVAYSHLEGDTRMTLARFEDIWIMQGDSWVGWVQNWTMGVCIRVFT